MPVQSFPGANLPSDDLVELSVLVPHWQVDALADLAQCHGVTAAQLVRRLIQAALRKNREGQLLSQRRFALETK